MEVVEWQLGLILSVGGGGQYGAHIIDVDRSTIMEMSALINLIRVN